MIQIEPTIKRELLSIHDELTKKGELYSKEVLQGYYDTFRQRFGPENLSQLDGEELLETIHAHGNKESLVYWLEFKDDEEIPAIFGGIGGGSALKFKIYRSKETGDWKTGSPRNQKVISVDEAIKIARSHRDQFVSGCVVLNDLADEPTKKDYEELQKKLSEVAPDVSETAWGHKYFSMMFPNQLDDFHNSDYQHYHLIKTLQTPPVDTGRYVSGWFFVSMAKDLNIPMNHLTWILNERHGRPVRYWRIGTRIGDVFRWDKMKKGSFVAVGWTAVGELSHIKHDRKSKDLLKKLIAEHYPAVPTQVGRQAAQLFNFVTTIQEGDIILVSDGAKVLGIGKVDSEYYHEHDSDYPNRRRLEWLAIGEWKMPTPEGLRTTVHQVRKHPVNRIEAERRILFSKPDKEIRPVRTRFSGIVGRIHNILERKKQIILYGPPGTGKTYWAQRAAQTFTAHYNSQESFENLTADEFAALGSQDSADIGYSSICCFHPEYGYEDFIEGYRPKLVSGQPHFKMCKGLFKRLCREASKASDKRFYLIIDEINRGDIPRIFGELIMVIEANKRGNSITLPVSGERFNVPSNVYIIGTMNTADRSIALLDTALRRRFGFFELMPDVGVLEDNVLEGIPIRLWLKALNERICQHIGRDARNLQVGHSYLMTGGRTVDTFRKFADIIREDVIPLLEEYCYEDFSILANLLGTSLVDETSMRIRDELFEPVSKEKLVSALLVPCPEIAASFRATDFETDEPETDNDETDEPQNGIDD